MRHKEIQELIRTKGLTQRELAKVAGVTEATFSQYIRRRFSSRRLAEMINRELGVNTGLR